MNRYHFKRIKNETNRNAQKSDAGNEEVKVGKIGQDNTFAILSKVFQIGERESVKVVESRPGRPAIGWAGRADLPGGGLVRLSEGGRAVAVAAQGLGDRGGTRPRHRSGLRDRAARQPLVRAQRPLAAAGDAVDGKRRRR